MNDRDVSHLRPIGAEFDEILPPDMGNAASWRFVRYRMRVIDHVFAVHNEWTERGRMLEQVEGVEREGLRWTDPRVMAWKHDNPASYWAHISYDEENAPEPEFWRKVEGESDG